LQTCSRCGIGCVGTDLCSHSTWSPRDFAAVLLPGTVATVQISHRPRTQSACHTFTHMTKAATITIQLVTWSDSESGRGSSLQVCQQLNTPGFRHATCYIPSTPNTLMLASKQDKGLSMLHTQSRFLHAGQPMGCKSSSSTLTENMQRHSTPACRAVC
jgi:hypothetical protein